DTAYRSKGSDVANEYQTGWEMGTGVGYEFKGFNSWLAPRAELELTYDQQLVDTSTTKGVKSTDPNAYGFQRNLDLMANGFLDFRLNRYLAPYVGGGVGVGYADFDRYGTSAGGVTMDDNDVGFVWQAMGGLGINISNSAMVDFGYRYQQNTGVTLKAEDGTTSTTDEGKHVIMIGFRNNF
ncbi:MAG: outer membrane beta-barrel protein, partial [Alphaproteobacteria bacterium]|nr:outer membrane beta-barrel protein [Alphaproteobacteria bacterium]